MRIQLLPLFLLAALAAAEPAAAAGPGTRVLTAGGDIYAVTQGRYGEVFPGGTAALAEDPVLAVSVIHPDGTSERLLVPESVGPAIEELASLVLAPDGETLHVLWQSTAADSSLRLSSLGADGWSATTSVSRGVPVLRGSLRAALTRTSAELTGEGAESPSRSHRSVLHVLWVEAGTGSVIYAPLVLGAGPYPGDHALFAIDQLVAPELEAGAPQGPWPAVALGPALEAGDDAGAAVTAFLLPNDGRLVGVEIRMIDSELSRLGNSLRAEILALSETLEPGSPDSLGALAAGARAHVAEAGGGLRPALQQLLATEIEDYVLDHGGDWAFQPEAMADRTRGRLIELGTDFDHAPVQRTGGGARPHLINLGQRWEGPLDAHDLRLRVTSVRRPPEIPEGTAGALLLSGDGEDALVAWEADGTAFFRESDESSEGGWGPAVGLGISGEDWSLVRGLLSARVRGR